MNIKSARNVAEFVHVLARDNEGRPTRFLVPGHESRRYKVQLRRNDGGLRAYCFHYDGKVTESCRGNQHCVCYHVLASCMVAANDQGKELSWCESQQDAERLARIDGQVFTVKSAQSGKLAYGVVKSDEVKTIPRLSLSGLSKDVLITLAVVKTEDKRQWFSGESLWLTEDAFLKNDDGFVRLYRADRSQKYPRSERLAIIWWLDPGNIKAGWQRYTAKQATKELFEP